MAGLACFATFAKLMPRELVPAARAEKIGESFPFFPRGAPPRLWRHGLPPTSSRARVKRAVGGIPFTAVGALPAWFGRFHAAVEIALLGGDMLELHAYRERAMAVSTDPTNCGAGARR